jgi:hypothetical protein
MGSWMSVIALGAAIAIGATLGSHAVLGFSLLVATAVGVATPDISRLSAGASPTTAKKAMVSLKLAPSAWRE